MPLFEVSVRQTSTVTYIVEAKDQDVAALKWTRADFDGEFVEEEQVVAVVPYDDRFGDDPAELTDDYLYEEEDTDE